MSELSKAAEALVEAVRVFAHAVVGKLESAVAGNTVITPSDAGVAEWVLELEGEMPFGTDGQLVRAANRNWQIMGEGPVFRWEAAGPFKLHPVNVSLYVNPFRDLTAPPGSYLIRGWSHLTSELYVQEISGTITLFADEKSAACDGDGAREVVGIVRPIPEE